MTIREIENEIIRQSNRIALGDLIHSEKIKECGIFCNPKIKSDLMYVFDTINIHIPIISNSFVESNKFYVVTDKELVERMKEVEKNDD